MRYNLHRPVLPVDPRKLQIDSYQHLHELLPVFAECDLEEEAAEAVFQIFPNGVAMPVLVSVGSGTVMMLGIVDNICATASAVADPSVTVPFALLVRALPEQIRDRDLIKNHKQFSRETWKAPVMDPLQPSIRACEIRGFFLEEPVMLAAKVGRHRDGRLVIRCEINGHAFSVAFAAPARIVFDDDPPRSITSG